jgi:hypothetical protein
MFSHSLRNGRRRCDEAGGDKKVCVKESRAAERRAKADAKGQMKTADATK